MGTAKDVIRTTIGGPQPVKEKTLKGFIRSIIGEEAVSLAKGYLPVVDLLYRELRRVLSLIRVKRQYRDDPEVLLSEVRTLAHVVDKGLQVNNWESNRSRGPYAQLCSHIEKLKDSSVNGDPSYLWAMTKKCEYECAQETGRVKWHGDTNERGTIEKDALFGLIKTRRSARRFEDRQISHETLRGLADVTSWAPTSCNRQPSKLFITQSPERIALCVRQCAGATCLGDVIPCFIAVCADSRFYALEDRNLPFVDVALGLQNLLLMAHVQGIEGTVLNWFHHSREEDTILREVLGIPGYYLIVANLVIGYCTETGPVPGRKGCDLAHQFVDPEKGSPAPVK